MRRRGLDDQDVDRLLTGAITPSDAPPGYPGVAELLAAATRPQQVDGETAREVATVTSMRSVIFRQPVPVPDARRKTAVSRALTAKVAAVATVAFLGAGTAAAATDSLPGAVQSAASSVLAKIGISAPTNSPDEHRTGGNPDGRPTTTSVVPTANRPADPGSQGQGQGNPPADPGSQGQGNPPADPGSQGQGQANKPADPGSQGQGQGNPPADPGGQGRANRPASSNGGGGGARNGDTAS